MYAFDALFVLIAAIGLVYTYVAYMSATERIPSMSAGGNTVSGDLDPAGRHEKPDRYTTTEFDWKRFGVEWFAKQGPFMVLFCVLLFWGIPKHLEIIQAGYTKVSGDFIQEQKLTRQDFLGEQKESRIEFAKTLDEIRKMHDKAP
jgi:hypothetical protein